MYKKLLKQSQQSLKQDLNFPLKKKSPSFPISPTQISKFFNPNVISYVRTRIQEIYAFKRLTSNQKLETLGILFHICLNLYKIRSKSNLARHNKTQQDIIIALVQVHAQIKPNKFFPTKNKNPAFPALYSFNYTFFQLFQP